MSTTTRYYLQNAGPSYTPPTKRGSWDASTATDAKKLHTTKAGVCDYAIGSETTSTTNWDVLISRFISEPLATARTITNLTGCVGMGCNSSNAGAYLHLHAYLTVGDTDVVRAVLINNWVSSTVISAVSWLGVAIAPTVSSADAQVGDRLVVEVGAAFTNTLTAEEIVYFYRGSTDPTDLTTSNLGYTYPSWFDITYTDIVPSSCNLTAAWQVDSTHTMVMADADFQGDANTAINWSLSPNLAVSSAVKQTDSKRVLITHAATTWQTNYTVTFSATSGTKTANFKANVVITNGSPVLALYPLGIPFTAVGNYLFAALVDAANNVKVNRFNTTNNTWGTEVTIGSVINYHMHPTITVDPTDNKMVVGIGGWITRPNTVYKPKISKSTGTYDSGTWNAFSAMIDLPDMPVSPEGGGKTYVSVYQNMDVCADGTLLMFSHGESYSGSYGAPMLMYRYAGDGTSKTATQLVGGSWTKIIEAPDYAAGQSVYSNRPQIRNIQGTERVGLYFNIYKGPIGSDPNTARRWGAAYIYSDDHGTTWKKANGTSLTLPIDTTAGGGQTDGTLFPCQDWADYEGDLVMLADGSPRLITARWEVTGTPPVSVGRGVSVYGYNNGWSESVIQQHDAYSNMGSISGTFPKATNKASAINVIAYNWGTTGSEYDRTIRLVKTNTAWTAYNDDSILAQAAGSEQWVDCVQTAIVGNTAYFLWLLGENTFTQPEVVCMDSILLVTIPAAPSNTTVTNNHDGTVTVNWTDNSNNEDNFEIQRAIKASPINADFVSVGSPLSANTTTVNDTLNSFCYVTYRVRSTNAAGSSAWATSTTLVVNGGSNLLLSSQF